VPVVTAPQSCVYSTTRCPGNSPKILWYFCSIHAKTTINWIIRMHSGCSKKIKIVIAVILSCHLLSAQHVHVMSTSGTGPAGLPIIVDGSKNPEAVPDDLAYRHFFAAFAAHPTPTSQELARQNAQLGPLQLAAADRGAFVGILGSFRVRLDQIEKAVAVAGTPANLASLQAQKVALAASTLANLRQTLTPAGVSRIDQYVQTRVKRHIVIYGGAM
jgi:hypothetical protein